jgi:hypothetical protein
MQPHAAVLGPHGRAPARELTPSLRRLAAAGAAVACSGVLVLAALMTPASDGLGTHRQLNLPNCGWITVMDLPCATCGMTTAFSHAVRGEMLASLLAQPLGFLFALATAMALLVSLHVAVTGSRLPAMFGRLWTTRAMWIVGALGLAAWLFKIASYKGWLA